MVKPGKRLKRLDDEEQEVMMPTLFEQYEKGKEGESLEEHRELGPEEEAAQKEKEARLE